MKTSHAYANCKVKHQTIDTVSGESSWQFYENLSLEAKNLDVLMERIDLYMGRPKPRRGVSAILLTGEVHINQKDLLYGTVDTITMDLRILRERASSERRKSS